MIKDLGFSNLVTSYLAALPAALGVLGMVLVSRNSDRTGERVWHVAACTLAAGLALVAVGAMGRLPRRCCHSPGRQRERPNCSERRSETGLREVSRQPRGWYLHR